MWLDTRHEQCRLKGGYVRNNALLHFPRNPGAYQMEFRYLNEGGQRGREMRTSELISFFLYFFPFLRTKGRERRKSSNREILLHVNASDRARYSFHTPHIHALLLSHTHNQISQTTNKQRISNEQTKTAAQRKHTLFSRLKCRDPPLTPPGCLLK